MRKFSMRSVKALLLAAALCCGGQAFAWHEPDVSNPIGMELEEQKETGYEFTNTDHANYVRYSSEGSATYYKNIYLGLPSANADLVYVKARLNDPSQAYAITFQIKETDKLFTNGAILITPDECTKEGSTQIIPFSFKVTGETTPGVYTYTFEAYTEAECTNKVAEWTGTVYMMEDYPSVTLPSMIYGDQFKLEVKKGDLGPITTQLVVELRTVDSYDPITFSEGFTLQNNPSDNQSIWVNTPQTLKDETIVGKLTSIDKGVAECWVSLKDTDGCPIVIAYCSILTPFSIATADQEALDAFVQSNCTELADYINNQQWQQNVDGNVRIEWTRANPSQIKSLKVTRQTKPLTLDLSKLTALQSLDLDGNTALQSPLNLSNATQLNNVSLYGVDNLTYKDIQFPKDFDGQQVYGRSKIRQIGSPRENEDVEVPMNTVIDLADYVGENNTITYSWQKNWEDIELTPVEGTTGTFKLKGNVDDRFECTIKNSLYPHWEIQTPAIYLTLGNLNYNTDDVAGLQQLAKDNPQNSQIQDFITKGFWKEQSWDNWNYPIWLKWDIDENNNAILTHLSLRLGDEYNDKTAPRTINLTYFKNLVHFSSNQLRYVENIDFSKCTQLESINFSASPMKSLDVSACTELRELQFDESRSLTGYILYSPTSTSTIALETLNFSGCTKLEALRIGRTKVSSLDVSALPNFSTLRIEYCPNLKTITGLESKKLTSLELINTGSLYQDLIAKLDLSSLTTLDYRGSDYALPDESVLANLKVIGLPTHTSTFDLDKAPKLTELGTRDSKLTYSALQGTYRNLNYQGETKAEIANAESLQSYPRILPGDKIDLSAEATIQGKSSTFTWYNYETREEEKNLFKETETPGVFVVDPNVQLDGKNQFICRIWNKAFSNGASLNSWSGWIMDTDVLTLFDASAYNENELKMLENIVTNSKCQDLKDWWNRGDWAGDGESAGWSGEVNGTYCELSWEWNADHRLRKLYILWFKDLMTGVLDISAAEELERIWFDNVNFSSCVFPAKSKLQEINIFNTNIALPTDVEFPSLQTFYASKAQTQLDLSKMPVLTYLDLYYTNYFKFSGILSPRKIERVWGPTIWIVSDKVYNRANYIGAGEHPTIDFSSETSVGATVTWKTWNAEGTYVDLTLPEIETGKYNISEALQSQKKIQAILKHENYPYWTICFEALLYTQPGDANIDGKVNVQDISATIPYILLDSNRSPIFGYYQADMDKNQAIEVADVIGIVNTIRGVTNPVMKSTFQPTVYVTSEADGKLYVDTQVPLAGLQLTFTGVEQEIPLMGEAARFAHAAHASDRLRMVAYSMNGSTIPAGRTLLAQLPKGATLVEAVFADANAQSLKADLSGIVTATEEIGSDPAAAPVTNYPNPFRGQTTFTYGVPEQADQAQIRIYSANGALVCVLSGLPTAPGENQHRATIDLPAGLYLYQLEISRAGRVISTQTNHLIIK